MNGNTSIFWFESGICEFEWGLKLFYALYLCNKFYQYHNLFHQISSYATAESADISKFQQFFQDWAGRKLITWGPLISYNYKRPLIYEMNSKRTHVCYGGFNEKEHQYFGGLPERVENVLFESIRVGFNNPNQILGFEGFLVSEVLEVKLWHQAE